MKSLICNKKFLLILIPLSFLLGSCNQSKSENVDESKIKYFTYYDEPISNGIANNFVFLNSEGNVIKTEILEMGRKKDIFYSELNSENKKFYMLGNGGLFEIDLIDYTAKMLSDDNINQVTFYGEKIFYYQNKGFKDDHYSAGICEISSGCTYLDYLVSDLYFSDNALFVAARWEDDYKLFQFTSNGIEESDLAFNVFSIHKINDVLYGHVGHAFLQLSNQKVLPFVDEQLEPLTLDVELFMDSKGNAYLLDSIQNILYSAAFNENYIVCSEHLYLEQEYTVYPSLVDDTITLVGEDSLIYTLNLVTKEINEEGTSFDLKRFYHTILLK